jgi:hypothetical protein
MNTPRWYGSIGVIEAPHRRLRGLMLRRTAAALAAALRWVGRGPEGRSRPRGIGRHAPPAIAAALTRDSQPAAMRSR